MAAEVENFGHIVRHDGKTAERQDEFRYHAAMSATTLIVKRSTVDEKYPGGAMQFERDATATPTSDGELLIATFEDVLHASHWVERLGAAGVAEDEVILREADHTHSSRFDVLSTSSSGLHYVRERRGGLMRVLTESEIADFDDPPPCPVCSEQFGCEHFNCAGEPMMSDGEVATDVPHEWLAFAKDYGISRGDLARFDRIECVEGEWRVKPGSASDVRTLELALLLNDAR